MRIRGPLPGDLHEVVGRPSENVWDYPRPPRLERFDGSIRIMHANVEVARGARAWRVLETTHPPTYYLPLDQLTDSGRRALWASSKSGSFCEWKGLAVYHDLRLPDCEPLRAVAWSYPEPSGAFAELRDCVAFYAGPLDCCEVDGEPVQRQRGDFYGGWITSWITGGERGFKGGPGTLGW